jgi:plasmid maintenance system antidote protein VapI
MQSGAQNRLGELMEREGVKRYEIAALCERDTTTVGRWITGEREIPAEFLRPLTERFDCTVEHLLGWDRESSSTTKAAA